MKKDVMHCPHCGRAIDASEFARALGKKGGAAGRGEAKRRTSEQARAAARARWDKQAKRAFWQNHSVKLPTVPETFESFVVRKIR